MLIASKSLILCSYTILFYILSVKFCKICDEKFPKMRFFLILKAFLRNCDLKPEFFNIKKYSIAIISLVFLYARFSLNLIIYILLICLYFVEIFSFY